MNKIAPILTVVCLGLLLAFNWGLLPPLPPLQQAPAPSIAPVPPSPPVAVDPHPTPSASPAEAHDLFLTELELYVHKLINEHRATVGRKPLALRSAALLALLDPPPHCGVPVRPGPLIPAALTRSAASPTSAATKRKRKIQSISYTPHPLEKDPRRRQGRRRTAGGWAQNLE